MANPKEIERILSTKDDGEGNPLNYKRSTIESALDKVPLMKTLVMEEKGIEITDPRILPGPYNSIDLHWDVEKYEILLNVEEDGNARYYAQFPDGSELKGNLKLT